jgi:hypothetical protein
MIGGHFRNTLIVVAAMLAVASFPLPALAYLDGFKTRTVVSANREYVLVLLMPPAERAGRRLYDPKQDGPLAEEDIQRWNDSVARQQQLEATYPQSGVYRNDGSPDLLWPMPYLTICKDIWLANDGEHVVVAFLGWDQSASSRGDALEFFSRGQSLAIYNEETLIKGIFSKMIAARCLGAGMPYARAAALDDASGRFELTTDSGEWFQFDVATGGMTSHWSPWPIYLGTPLMAVPLLIWGAVRWERGRSLTVAASRRGWRFTIRELLGAMVLVAACLVAMRQQTMPSSACAVCLGIVAVGGAIGARVAANRWGMFIGAAAALYGAYAAVLAFALAEIGWQAAQQTRGLGIEFWLMKGWGLVAWWATIAVGSIVGALLGGRLALRRGVEVGRAF